MSQLTSNHVQIKASTTLVVTGYVFAVLGGLIGVAIGANLKNSKVNAGDGQKLPKYDTASRRHGLAILLVSLVMIAVGFGINVAMQ